MLITTAAILSTKNINGCQVPYNFPTNKQNKIRKKNHFPSDKQFPYILTSHESLIG